DWCALRDLERGRDLGIRPDQLMPEDVAAHMTAASLDLVEKPDQGVHERFRRARPGDEGALALHPLDEPLVLQLRESLAHHGARDAVLLAQPVLARQRVAGLEAVVLDVVDDQLTQLVVHRRGGAAVDSGRRAHQYATPACRITFAYGVNSPERTKARAAWVRFLNSTCGTSSISMPGSRSRSASST